MPNQHGAAINARQRRRQAGHGVCHLGYPVGSRHGVRHIEQRAGNGRFVFGRLVESRILHRHRDLIGQRCQDEQVFGGERVQFTRLHIEHAQHAVFDQQRRGQLGAGVRQQAWIVREVARF